MVEVGKQAWPLRGHQDVDIFLTALPWLWTVVALVVLGLAGRSSKPGHCKALAVTIALWGGSDFFVTLRFLPWWLIAWKAAAAAAAMVIIISYSYSRSGAGKGCKPPDG